MASRTNRRTDGTTLMFIADLAAITYRHLPETREADLKRNDPWKQARMRREVSDVIDALAQRHIEGTGQAITKSEIIAAALNLSLPVLSSLVFPASVPD